MHPPGTPKSEDAALQQLWRRVCASRGTPAPDRDVCGQFLQGLGEGERRLLESVLLFAARGQEKPGDLNLLSWAAACTRPALLDQLAARGLAFAGAHLFACSLQLMQSGWDMPSRLAQLDSHPEDVATLRDLLPAGKADAPPASPTAAEPGHPEEDAVVESCFPWHGDGPPESHALGWDAAPREAMDESPVASTPSPALPELPTRFARQRPEPSSSTGASGAASAERAPDEGRLRLRLFGKAAAHTLEVTPHRRGGDFLGVHVVSIDSAHALGSGGGYAWERKVVIQLTPEEMPAAIAVLMNLSPSARFGQHGVERDKFVELRRQADGLVVVTGQGGSVYAVPVRPAAVYYLLGLFARAMVLGLPGAGLTDVLALVKASQ